MVVQKVNILMARVFITAALFDENTTFGKQSFKVTLGLASMLVLMMMTHFSFCRFRFRTGLEFGLGLKFVLEFDARR